VQLTPKSVQGVTFWTTL